MYVSLPYYYNFLKASGLVITIASFLAQEASLLLTISIVAHVVTFHFEESVLGHVFPVALGLLLGSLLVVVV